MKESPNQAHFNRIKASLGLALSALLSLIMTLGLLLPVRVHAQSSSDDFGDRMHDMMSCGMWYGANFDIVNGMNCANIALIPETSHSVGTPPSSPPPSTSDGPSSDSGSSQTHPAPSIAPAPPQPAPSAPSNTLYAALGDSIPAGLGLGTGGTPADRQCRQSTQGYPNIVAGKLHMSLINASCTGATMGDLLTKQSVNGPNVPPQLDTAYRSGAPTLISITAGANDVRWAEFISACYTTDCTSNFYKNAQAAYLQTIKRKLQAALSDIGGRSTQVPRVVVTGYYQPLCDRCANQQQGVTASEVQWVRSATDSLNETLKSVSSQFAFARFSTLDFAGHELCSSNPWVQGINDPAPFHPNALGQQAIAKSVIVQTN